MTAPRGWIAACTLAETIGMTAAAAVGRVAHDWVGTDSSGAVKAGALALVVAGGLVEGAALGLLQAARLRAWRPGFPAARWATMTVLVAGLGWAGASAPSALQPDSGDGSPPWLLVVPGALALGALLGVVLGAAQSVALPGHVRHPRRWMTISAIGWAPAMAVIFAGASVPGSDWPLAAVVATGTGAGAAAGALLGAVTAALFPALNGPTVPDRIVLALAPVLRRRLAVLSVRGRSTGATFTFPVQYAATDDGFVVVPGHPERKQWWRNLRRPSMVRVRVGRDESIALGALLEPDDPGYDQARSAYQQRWHVPLPAGAPLVRLTVRNG